jgi:hypothetical protein
MDAASDISPSLDSDGRAQHVAAVKAGKIAAVFLADRLDFEAHLAKLVDVV